MVSLGNSKVAVTSSPGCAPRAMAALWALLAYGAYANYDGDNSGSNYGGSNGNYGPPSPSYHSLRAPSNYGGYGNWQLQLVVRSKPRCGWHPRWHMQPKRNNQRSVPGMLRSEPVRRQYGGRLRPLQL